MLCFFGKQRENSLMGNKPLVQRKGRKMKSVKIAPNIFRLIAGSGESDVFYYYKSGSGWVIKNQGKLFNFAYHKKEAEHMILNRIAG